MSLSSLYPNSYVFGTGDRMKAEKRKTSGRLSIYPPSDNICNKISIDSIQHKNNGQYCILVLPLHPSLHSEKVSNSILNMNEEHLVQDKNILAPSIGADIEVYADTINVQPSLMQQ